MGTPHRRRRDVTADALRHGINPGQGVGNCTSVPVQVAEMLRLSFPLVKEIRQPIRAIKPSVGSFKKCSVLKADYVLTSSEFGRQRIPNYPVRPARKGKTL